MNAALWKKALVDSASLLFWLTVLLFGFAWIFVWLSSLISLPAMLNFFLTGLPPEFERLSGVPFREVATPAGRIALAYVDPVVLFGLTVWSIARGSDIVAGELGRGTLEMILAQPVSRLSVYATQAAVTTIGAAVLSLAVWLGTLVGISLVELPQEVPAAIYVPAAVNLFGMTFFLAGLASLVSAFDSYRGRVIGLVGGFYVASMILKVIGRMAPGWSWVGYGSFLVAVEPQALVGSPDSAWAILARYDAVLIGLGLLAYAIGAIVFCRRDLPAPL